MSAVNVLILIVLKMNRKVDEEIRYMDYYTISEKKDY